MENDSGAPTGRGICEYKDEEVAHSAQRNLNGVEVRGRPLKIETSHGSAGHYSSGSSASESGAGPMKDVAVGGAGDGSRSSAHVEDVSPAESVERVVSQLSDTELHELLWHTKQLITENPDYAKNLLSRTPQFCYGLMQALIKLQFVSPSEAQSFFLVQQQVPVQQAPVIAQPIIGIPNLLGSGIDMSALAGLDLTNPAVMNYLYSMLAPGSANPLLGVNPPLVPILQTPTINPALGPEHFYNPAGGLPPRPN